VSWRAGTTLKQGRLTFKNQGTGIPSGDHLFELARHGKVIAGPECVYIYIYIYINNDNNNNNNNNADDDDNDNNYSNEYNYISTAPAQGGRAQTENHQEVFGVTSTSYMRIGFSCVGVDIASFMSWTL
jgi:hypothetical protein